MRCVLQTEDSITKLIVSKMLKIPMLTKDTYRKQIQTKYAFKVVDAAYLNTVIKMKQFDWSRWYKLVVHLHLSSYCVYETLAYGDHYINHITTSTSVYNLYLYKYNSQFQLWMDCPSSCQSLYYTLIKTLEETSIQTGT